MTIPNFAFEIYRVKHEWFRVTFPPVVDDTVRWPLHVLRGEYAKRHVTSESRKPEKALISFGSLADKIR